MQRKRKKLDGIDAEQVEGMVLTRGWQLYVKRLEQTLQVKANELATDLDVAKTAKVRGFLEGLQLAARIPAILIAEAKARPAKKDSE